MSKWGFPVGASGKELSSQCRRHKRCEFDPWLGKIPWRRQGMATHSRILAWRIPWTEELGRLWCTGLQSRTWLKWLMHVVSCLAVNTPCVWGKLPGRRKMGTCLSKGTRGWLMWAWGQPGLWGRSTTSQDRRGPGGAVSSHLCMRIYQQPQLLSGGRTWEAAFLAMGNSVPRWRAIVRVWAELGEKERSVKLPSRSARWPARSSLLQDGVPGFNVSHLTQQTCAVPLLRRNAVLGAEKRPFILLFLLPGVTPATGALF